jgi:hypothetical protein
MHEHAKGTDAGKPEKPDWNDMADKLIEEQHQILPHNLAVKLTVSGMASTKLVREFFEAQWLRGRSKYIDKNFEPNA